MAYHQPIKLAGAALIACIALIGCAPQSSKPLKQYTQVKKTLGPAHTVPAPVQSYQETDLYTLAAEPSNPTFNVGVENKVLITAALKFGGVKYDLVSNDLPRGSKLIPLGNGTWEFNWTPSYDLMSSFKNNPQGQFHVAIQIKEVVDLRAKNVAETLSAEMAINYNLNFSKSSPEIVEIKGVAPKASNTKTKLNEGDIVDIVILVKDNSSTDIQKPQLITRMTPNRVDKEGRVLSISGHRFLIPEGEPTRNKDGLWAFNAKFDTKNNDVPDFITNDKKSVQASIGSDLTFKILGANEVMSPEQIISFEINYRHELLRPNFNADVQLQMVPQTSTWTYNFQTYLSSVIGTMGTPALSDETVKLPGNPKLKCTLDSKSKTPKRNCTVTWKIPCEMTPGDVAIKVISSAQYQDQNTSTELQKKLTITEHKKCVKVTPAASTTASEIQPTADSQTEEVTPAKRVMTPPLPRFKPQPPVSSKGGQK